MPHLPAPAAGLMPHRRPVRLVERLLEARADSGRADARIREDRLYVNPDGRLDPTAHLELIAQTFAAVKGWRDRQRSVPPQIGYLAGIDDVSFSGTARVGDRVTAAMQETERIGSFVIIRGQVHLRDRCLAQGRLKLWLAPRKDTPAAAPSVDAQAPSIPLIPMSQGIEAACVGTPEWEGHHTIVGAFRFPPTFGAFQGHFPGNPVFPAFAQVRMVLFMLTSAWQAPLELKGLDRAKFREPLLPEKTVHVCCRLEERPAICLAAATLTVADHPLSAFQIIVR